MLTVLKDKSFYKKVFLIMIPAMVQSLIQMGVNLMDNVMVGQLGETQISAASLTNTFVMLFMMVLMGIGTGSNVLGSQYWGAEDKDSVHYVFSLGLRITFVISAVFAAAMILVPGMILSIFTNQTPVIERGSMYMRLLGITIIFQGLTTVSTHMLRSAGQVKIPMISSIIAFFVNVFFNWVFIFGKLGAPRLEIVGAAIGTIIARVLDFCIVVGYLVLVEKKVAFRLKHLFMKNKSIFHQFLQFSLPVIISDTFLGVGLSATSAVLGHMSEAMVAANSTVGALSQVTNIYANTLSLAAGVVIGNTLGEGDKKRAYNEGKAFVILALAFGCLGTIVVMILHKPFLSLYEITDETYDLAISIFHCLFFLLPLQCLSNTLSKGVLRGGGDTKFMMVADVVLLWCASLPLGYAAGLIFHWPAGVVYFCLHFEYSAKGIICLIRFLSGKSLKTIGERREAEKRRS